MAWIEERETQSGTNYYVYWYENGRRKCKACGSRKSVAIEARNKKQEDVHRQNFNLSNPNTTVGELIKDFLAYSKEEKKASTVKHLKYGLDKLKDEMGNRALMKVNIRQMEDFRTRLLKDHEVNGLNFIFNAVTACFQYAVNREYITKNPAKGMKLKAVKVSRFLTQAEITTLMQTGCAFNKELQRVINIAVHTGMRVSEIANMKREHIKGGFIHIEKNKTDTPRLVPIHPAIENDLKYFPFTRWSRNRIERAFGRAVKRSKLARIRFHDLRHTFCSSYLQSGGTIADLKEISGHKTLQALQHYAHFQPNYLKERIMNLRFQ